MSAPSILPQAFPSWDMQHVHTVAMAATQHIADPKEREQAYIAARGQVCAGMSLRDYFAAQLMPLVMSRATGRADAAAKQAYELADAMLKARAS